MTGYATARVADIAALARLGSAGCVSEIEFDGSYVAFLGFICEACHVSRLCGALLIVLNTSSLRVCLRQVCGHCRQIFGQ